MPFLPLGPLEEKPPRAMFAWIGGFMLVSTFVFAVNVSDQAGSQPFEIPRYLSAVTAQNRTFVLWQDYRELYGAVNLVEYDPVKGAGPVHTLRSGHFDCARPKAFPYGKGLMVSWLEFHKTETFFYFAEYDIRNGTMGNGIGFPLKAQIQPDRYDHSFDGRNFILAHVSDGRLLLWKYDLPALEQRSELLQTPGRPSALCQNGSTTYFGVNHDGYFTLFRFESGVSENAGDFKGELREICGRDRYISFLSKGGSEGWGRVGLTNGNRTATKDIPNPARGLSMKMRPDGAFLAWSEMTENPDDDDQVNYEVRLATIFDLASPAFETIRTASARDGHFSTEAAMVATAPGGRLFWLDGSEGFSMWSAGFTASSVSGPSPVLRNGEDDSGIGFIVLMAVALGSMFAMLFLLIKGQSDETSLFIHNHDPRSYLFLRFFLPILIFLVVILQIGYIGGSASGSDFGSRIGHMNLVLLSISPVAATLALALLRREIGVSGFHRLGYAALALSLAVSLSGLLLYLFAREASDPAAVGLIRILAVTGYGLCVIGPFVMLFGLSRNRGFFAPVVAFGAMIAASAWDAGRLADAVVFPSLVTASRLLGETSEFYIIMVGMTIGLVSGFTLISGLKLSDIRSPGQWTRAETMYERNRALMLSVLMATPMTLFSVVISIGQPMPGQMMVEGGFWMGVIIICALPGLIYLFRSIEDVKSFPDSFRKNPSTSIYLIYCMPAIYSIFVMIATFILGAFGLLFLALYIEGIWRAEKAVKTLHAGETPAPTGEEE